jgi:hypothetical protein
MRRSKASMNDAVVLKKFPWFAADKDQGGLKQYQNFDLHIKCKLVTAHCQSHHDFH